MLPRKPGERHVVVSSLVFAGDADELGQVLEARARVVRVLALQLAHVSGLLHDGDQQVGDADPLGALAQVDDQIRESLELLELLGHRRAQQVGVEHRLADRDPRGVRGLHERRERLLTDAAARDVDDALERESVGGVDDVAQVRDDIFDLGARVEPDAADDPVGNPLGEQRLFVYARLRVGAIEHDEVSIGRRRRARDS